MKTLTLCASPAFDHSEPDFMFKTIEEFYNKFSLNLNTVNNPVYKYDIQFLNGTRDQVLFNLLYPVNQGNLDVWFEFSEIYAKLTDLEEIAVNYLVGQKGYFIKEALAACHRVKIQTGGTLEYVKELLDRNFNLTAALGVLIKHFDYIAYSMELESSGLIETIHFQNVDYVVFNANSFENFKS